LIVFDQLIEISKFSLLEGKRDWT